MYGSVSLSFGKPFVANGSSASVSTTHGLMLVPKFFALKGPRGVDSHDLVIISCLYSLSLTRSSRTYCTSLADQSFIITSPNIASSASSIGIGSPILFALHTKAASSISKSSLLHGDWIGFLFSSNICPIGRLIGVPDTTIEDALPWYPTGR